MINYPFCSIPFGTFKPQCLISLMDSHSLVVNLVGFGSTKINTFGQLCDCVYRNHLIEKILQQGRWHIQVIANLLGKLREKAGIFVCPPLLHINECTIYSWCHHWWQQSPVIQYKLKTYCFQCLHHKELLSYSG